MDKLQALLDAVNCMAFAPNGLHRREMLAALESLQSALASGEVVVTSFYEYSGDCPHHPMVSGGRPELGIFITDKTLCSHSGNIPGTACSRTNCPRLSHA